MGNTPFNRYFFPIFIAARLNIIVVQTISYETGTKILKQSLIQMPSIIRIILCLVECTNAHYFPLNYLIFFFLTPSWICNQYKQIKNFFNVSNEIIRVVTVLTMSNIPPDQDQ